MAPSIFEFELKVTELGPVVAPAVIELGNPSPTTLALSLAS